MEEFEALVQDIYSRTSRTAALDDIVEDLRRAFHSLGKDLVSAQAALGAVEEILGLDTPDQLQAVRECIAMWKAGDIHEMAENV